MVTLTEVAAALSRQLSPSHGRMRRWTFASTEVSSCRQSHRIKLNHLPKIHHDQILAEIIGSSGRQGRKVKQMRAPAEKWERARFRGSTATGILILDRR
jgi:hypothetical protein